MVRAIVLKQVNAFLSFFPRVSQMQGCEHVLSLFCKDLLNIPQFKKLVTYYRVLYGVFGCGGRHLPYSIFSEKAKQNNPTGQKIGLIRVAETRMGGYFYSFYRLLRLHRALKQTIYDEHYEAYKFAKTKNRKFDIKETVKRIVEDKQFFQCIKTVVILMFPVIKCLRLADSNRPGMDKLWYFVRLCTKKIKDILPKIDSHFSKDFDFEVNISNSKELIKENQESEDRMQRDLNVDDEFEDNEMDDFSDSESDDEESTSDDDDDISLSSSNTTSIRDKIWKCWEMRSSLMKTDYTIAGWLLSIEPEIFEDAKSAKKKTNSA